MSKDYTIEALLALVRGGLWEKEISLSDYGTIDYAKILLLAQEQADVGLVTAGLEHVLDVKVPKDILLQYVGYAVQLEHRNAAMNHFIEDIVTKMREQDIFALLVKGQGIAQCYERPSWRTSGDIDLFLNNTNYNKAKKFLGPLSSKSKKERRYSLEWGLNMDTWNVELHGSLRTGLSTRVDSVVDEVQRSVFNEGLFRSWQNNKTQVFLPAENEDVFIVFTHFIKHFYKEGGVKLRQMCDWCRLLWTYRDTIDTVLLEKRLRQSRLMREWKAFAAVAVDYLGMPIDAMPLYDEKMKWSKKAEKIIAYILKGGEWRRFEDTWRVSRIFPLNTFRFLPGILFNVNWLKIKERVFAS